MAKKGAKVAENPEEINTKENLRNLSRNEKFEKRMTDAEARITELEKKVN